MEFHRRENQSSEDRGRPAEEAEPELPRPESEAERVARLHEQVAAGNPLAHVLLGCMYAEGVGVGRDTTRAESLLGAAAEQGDEVAQYLLGQLILASNQGCGLSAKRAAELFSHSAERSFPEGEVCLGVLCAVGRGQPRDATRADELFRRAVRHAVVEYDDAFTVLEAAGRCVDELGVSEQERAEVLSRINEFMIELE